MKKLLLFIPILMLAQDVGRYEIKTIKIPITETKYYPNSIDFDDSQYTCLILFDTKTGDMYIMSIDIKQYYSTKKEYASADSGYVVYQLSKINWEIFSKGEKIKDFK